MCSLVGALETPTTSGCQDLVCRTLCYLENDYKAFADTKATVRVGISMPNWLKATIEQPETLPALRRRLRLAIQDFLRSGQSCPGQYCLLEHPLDLSENAIDADHEKAVFVIDITLITQYCEPPSNRRKRKLPDPPVDWQKVPLVLNDISYAVTTAPLVYRGRYRKTTRDVAQTKWINKDFTSIEEYLAGVALLVHGSLDCSLVGAGREDVDVCMLGTGRPFLFVVRNPKIRPSCPMGDAIMKEEYSFHEGRVQILDLRFVTEGFQEAQECTKDFSEEDKLKEYGCLIAASANVTEELIDRFNEKYAQLPELTPRLCVQQLTPSRVAHRRANLSRHKELYGVTLRRISERLLAAKILGSAGLYIKEFVNGDFGRTTPSLPSLLKIHNLDLLQLDVLNLSAINRANS